LGGAGAQCTKTTKNKTMGTEWKENKRRYREVGEIFRV
jgi:hypothetical protein